jgi:methylated-DNA-protein-cysteine methyltransferase-like protein
MSPDVATYQRIYAIVRRIPRGRVATYGQIAALAGMPRHARQVGYALAHAPDNVVLPWHRVLNASGHVSLRARPGSDDFQQVLLEAEGVEFGLGGRVMLSKYQWVPRVGVATTRGRARVRSHEKPRMVSRSKQT